MDLSFEYSSSDEGEENKVMSPDFSDDGDDDSSLHEFWQDKEEKDDFLKSCFVSGGADDPLGDISHIFLTDQQPQDDEAQQAQTRQQEQQILSQKREHRNREISENDCATESPSIDEKSIEKGRDISKYDCFEGSSCWDLLQMGSQQGKKMKEGKQKQEDCHGISAGNQQLENRAMMTSFSHEEKDKKSQASDEQERLKMMILDHQERLRSSRLAAAVAASKQSSALQAAALSLPPSVLLHLSQHRHGGGFEGTSSSSLMASRYNSLFQQPYQQRLQKLLQQNQKDSPKSQQELQFGQQEQQQQQQQFVEQNKTGTFQPFPSTQPAQQGQEVSTKNPSNTSLKNLLLFSKEDHKKSVFDQVIANTLDPRPLWGVQQELDSTRADSRCSIRRNSDLSLQQQEQEQEQDGLTRNYPAHASHMPTARSARVDENDFTASLATIGAETGGSSTPLPWKNFCRTTSEQDLNRLIQHQEDFEQKQTNRHSIAPINQEQEISKLDEEDDMATDQDGNEKNCYNDSSNLSLLRAFGMMHNKQIQATAIPGTQEQQETREQQQAIDMTRLLPPVSLTFPNKLYKMVDEAEANGYSHIISFSPDGQYFLVHDKTRFVSEVMPRYFKQSRFASFHRQLNSYGFVKISNSRLFTFHHPSFRRGYKNQLRNIRRKKKTP